MMRVRCILVEITMPLMIRPRMDTLPAATHSTTTVKAQPPHATLYGFAHI
jgi:hypothetical protein